MARSLATKNPPESDIVYTPEYLAIEIINHFEPTGKILEPCYGAGVFFNNYPQECQKDFCELAMGKDFLTYYEEVDWIITNPPWSKFAFFLEKSMQIANDIVFLVPFNNYTTKKRLRLIKQYDFGIKEVYCVKNPKGDNWPQMGFQLAAVHIQKYWKNGTFFTGAIGE